MAYTTVDTMVQFLSIIFAVLLQMQVHILIIGSSYVGRPNTRYSAKSRDGVVTGKFSKFTMANNVYCVFKIGTAAMLDIVASKIWRRRKSRPTGIYLHAKFGDDV